jgi:ribosomal protein S18 acetylase RimI-like enzyme
MAWQKSRKIVWLKAMDGSPAVRFYESQGFKVTDTFALDLPHIKNDKRGMLVMEKKLSQDKSETGMIEWHFIPG